MSTPDPLDGRPSPVPTRRRASGSPVPASAPGSALASPGDDPHRGAVRSRLLAALAPDDRAALEPHLEAVALAVGQVLAEPGEPLAHVYFPETAIFSVIHRMADGAAVEVGTVGNEGLVGLAALLEAEASESQTLAQIPGTAVRLPAAVLVEAVAARPALRRLLHRYTQAYLTQVAQGAACNRLHGIEARCARWLLMTHDRVGGADVFPLTQEFLAIMLGVRRSGVTLAAGALQDAGLIRYRRGGIRVLDRAGLEAAACECYGAVRRQYDRLLP
jgi:CRP-like cAMP-binding protein